MRRVTNSGRTSTDPADPRKRVPAAGQKLFILSLRCGRLANRLVIFANFIALAEELGHRVCNVPFHSYAHLFESTRGDIYCRYPAPARRSVCDVVPGLATAIRKTRIFYHVARASTRLNEMVPIGGRKVVTLREWPNQEVTRLEDPAVQARFREARVVFAYGWRFRAPTWVVRHAEKIRAHLPPNAEYLQASRETVARVRRQADVVVGVHVRRGDYLTWHDGRFYYEVPRYAAWMKEMAGRFPGRRVGFLVCSNEPRTVEEFPGLSVTVGQGPAVVDLFALAECDYLVGPPSTYSQWASFYGNKPYLYLRSPEARIELEHFRVSDLLEIP